MLLFPAQVKISRRKGWFRRRTSCPPPGKRRVPYQEHVVSLTRKENMSINVNNNGAANLVAATATAGVYIGLTNAHARIYAIPLVLAVFAALIGLTTWNLAHGGSAALGNFTLSGRKTAPPQTPPPTAPPYRPAPPSSAEPPASAAAPPARCGGAGTVIGLILLAGVVAYAFITASASGQPAAGATTSTPGKAVTSAGPASVIYAYYAAVNDRDWPKAWELAGHPAAVDSTAYNQWVDGYSCTVRDQITGITARGAALLVSVRAHESGGVIQVYRLSYVVRDGILTHPQTLSFTGHAPRGCGK